jgi:hypothetical protein
MHVMDASVEQVLVTRAALGTYVNATRLHVHVMRTYRITVRDMKVMGYDLAGYMVITYLTGVSTLPFAMNGVLTLSVCKEYIKPTVLGEKQSIILNSIRNSVDVRLTDELTVK